MQLVKGSAGNQYAPRIAKLLKPSRHVDAVAEQVVPLGYNVPDVDPNAKDDALVLGRVDLLRDNAFLKAGRKGNCVNDGYELEDRSVTHKLDSMAAVLRKERINNHTAQLSYRSQRSRLVGFYKPRVSDNIGGDYRNEAPMRLHCHSIANTGIFQHQHIPNIGRWRTKARMLVRPSDAPILAAGGAPSRAAGPPNPILIGGEAMDNVYALRR
ncbi:hypothetical protein MesoLj131a_34240 [Mesorhizobium sp. 131-2-1]|nr:hypothetical protein MesoLj131a_34240 [Mesorhizobium sp. 131-2-1]